VDYYYDDRPYVSVGERRAKAALELAKLQKKGRRTSPVVIDGRKIATTFWGEAWCGNLERYSDFANRLPRGRTYVRNGSVVDLQVLAGGVTALVSGSRMYEVKVTVAPVTPAHWNAVCDDCSGAIDSLVELLQGRFSKSVMARLCEQKSGLFPSPQDIIFTCSCPDWASMCKHVAAVLYGIGARLDHQPELLFTLRKVDQQDLITQAGSDLSKPRKGPATGKVLATDDLSAMFGIEIGPATLPHQATTPTDPTSASRAITMKPSRKSSPKHPSRPAAETVRASTAAPAIRVPKRLTKKKRDAISTRMKKYWAAKRASRKKS
jgi:uncharacterized Zn finger protein